MVSGLGVLRFFTGGAAVLAHCATSWTLKRSRSVDRRSAKSAAPTALSARARADSARWEGRRASYAIAVAMFSVVVRCSRAEMLFR